MIKRQPNINSPKLPEGPEIIGEATDLIESLEKCSKDRKLVRRRICKYLRDNQSYLKRAGWNDGWILGKIEGGYLGDLTDASLIDYAKLVERRKQWKLTK